jgi:predicted SAM-dependent methyltransferase
VQEITAQTINMRYPPDMTAHVHLRDFIRAFTLRAGDGTILHHGPEGPFFASEIDMQTAVMALHLSSRGRWALMLPDGRFAATDPSGAFTARSDHDDDAARFFWRETPEGGYFVAPGNRLLAFDGTIAAVETPDDVGPQSLTFSMERVTATSGLARLGAYGLTRFGTAEEELERFGARVRALIAAGEPVKIYAGSGLTIRPGFLNIDLKMPRSNLVVKEELENLFCFAIGEQLPIGDNCIDYVLSEDFFEHIPQIVQVKFLAEMRRVLKPGAINRINTPCLAASMAKHSDFDRGAAGVYEPEWVKWGHVSIMTADTLKDLARITGYADCVLTSRDEGTSAFHDGCIRPKVGRDHVTGNIYADLVA